MSTISRMLVNGGQQALRTTAVLLLLCGLCFPLLMTGLGALFFPYQASGSPIELDGKIVGSEHVGQDFTAECYLHGRPSAYHYNTYYEQSDGTQMYNDDTEFGGLSSGSYNYAASNPDLTARVQDDVKAFTEANPDADIQSLPSELFTASGSGLDPHISPASAEVQIPRIAKASGLSEDEIRTMIADNTEHKAFGIFGEEGVNVLLTNIAIYEAINAQ